ncbi:hypothetical protein EPO33_02600 [Patescibacteria group bacterium]|nr:MAG: hypothetical protein EPO33_02600 [Patescibacteria group bacterium]
MLATVKSRLRRSWAAIGLYRALKNAAVFPLRFTPLRTLQLKNMPLADLAKPWKIDLLRKVSPYTKNGYPRLSNIFDCATDVERRKLPGAFVECGTWKGGTTAVMGAVAHRFGGTRTTWYFDSFEGMPAPAPQDGSKTDEIAGDVLKASVADVEELVFGTLHLPREKNRIVKGWFEHTLPDTKAQIGPIALLRLDADWYEATKLILNELYDQVVPGGWLIFDDYGRWQGCKTAVDEFFAARGLSPKLHFVGSRGGVYGDRLAPMFFRKT